MTKIHSDPSSPTPQAPVIEQIAKVKQINFHILKNSETKSCQFWLALSRLGSLTTKDLLDKPDIKSIFHAAYNIGLNETQASLIVNTHLEVERYIYLLPIQEHSDFKPHAIWMAEIANAIKSLQVDKIGFYLPPQVFQEEDVDENNPNLFESVMRHLVLSTNITDFCLLSGDHGSNFMLNAALFLKEDLMEESKANISIFH